MHVVSFKAPTDVENFPAVHRVHSMFPVVFLYLPASHAMQMDPSYLLYPALHTQSAAAELPTGNMAFSQGCVACAYIHTHRCVKQIALVNNLITRSVAGTRHI